MKDNMLKALIELLKVKSIITILSFLVFLYLAIIGKINSDNFMLILSMIATYFFNKDIKQCIQISEESTYYVSLSTNIIFRGDLTDIQIALNRVEDDFKGLR